MTMLIHRHTPLALKNKGFEFFCDDGDDGFTQYKRDFWGLCVDAVDIKRIKTIVTSSPSSHSLVARLLPTAPLKPAALPVRTECRFRIRWQRTGPAVPPPQS